MTKNTTFEFSGFFKLQNHTKTTVKQRTNEMKDTYLLLVNLLLLLLLSNVLKNLEVDAVAHALPLVASRGDSQTILAITLADSVIMLQQVKSGMRSPGWNVSTVNIHLRKPAWMCCPGHAGVKGNDRADSLAGKATLTGGLLLEIS